MAKLSAKCSIDCKTRNKNALSLEMKRPCLVITLKVDTLGDTKEGMQSTRDC